MAVLSLATGVVGWPSRSKVMLAKSQPGIVSVATSVILVSIWSSVSLPVKKRCRASNPISSPPPSPLMTASHISWEQSRTPVSQKQTADPSQPYRDWQPNTLVGAKTGETRRLSTGGAGALSLNAPAALPLPFGPNPLEVRRTDDGDTVMGIATNPTGFLHSGK